MGFLSDIIHDPFPDAMGKAEHSGGGFFRLALGSNAYLRDDFLNAANDARPHTISAAVEALFEMLSGFGQSPLKGSTILPVDDPSAFCVENHLICTTIMQFDPMLLEKLDSCKKAGIATCVGVVGPFWESARAISWEGAIEAASKGTRGFFEGQVNACLENTFAACEAGADCVVISDDVGSASSLLAPPDFIREYLVPLWGEMAENASALGVPALFHSDGDIRSIYGSLAEASISGVHIAPGTDLRLIEACFAAAKQVDLIPIGGIPAKLLGDEANIALLEDHIYRLARRYPQCIIADDGGMTTKLESDTLARVYCPHEHDAS